MWGTLLAFKLGPVLALFLGRRVGEIWIDWWHQRYLKRAACEMVDEGQAFAADAPEIVEASPGDFPRLDLPWYDRIEAELTQLGFRKLADVEDLMETRHFPHLRRFSRFMVNAESTHVASFVHVLVQEERVPRKGRRMNVEDQHIVGFACETDEGIFLETINTIADVRVEGTIFGGYPPATPLNQLWEAHLESVQKRIASGQFTRLRPVRTLEDLKRGIRQQHKAASRNQGLDQAIQHLVEDELKKTPESRPLLEAYRRERQRRGLR